MCSVNKNENNDIGIVNFYINVFKIKVTFKNQNISLVNVIFIENYVILHLKSKFTLLFQSI